MSWPPRDITVVSVGDLTLWGQDPQSLAVFYAPAPEGWSGGDLRQTFIPRPNHHGAFPPVSFYDARKMTLTGWVAGTDLATRRLGLARLKAELAGLDGTALRVQEPPFDRTVTVYLNGPMATVTSGAVTQFSQPLVATDPIRYGTTPNVVPLTLPQAGAGVAWPVTYPVAYSPNSGGDTILSNAGDVEVWPHLRIDGPVTNPVVENVDSGQLLTLNITLGAGDWLDIDGRDEIVTLDGTTSRRTAVSAGSLFPTVPPGTSSWQFRSSDSAAAGLLTITYSDGWS